MNSHLPWPCPTLDDYPQPQLSNMWNRLWEEYFKEGSKLEIQQDEMGKMFENIAAAVNVLYYYYVATLGEDADSKAVYDYVTRNSGFNSGLGCRGTNRRRDCARCVS
jgi:hypothetical protein